VGAAGAGVAGAAAGAETAGVGAGGAPVADAEMAGAGVAIATVAGAGAGGDVFIFDAVVEVETTAGCVGVAWAFLKTDVRAVALRGVTGDRAAPTG